MRSVMVAMPAMKSSRLSRPFSICESLNSHSPVKSARQSSSTSSPRSSVISWNALAVGMISRPSRSMYFSVNKPSMVAARVAGVPRPFSCMASRSSSSSICLPALSMAPSSVASE
jgi:hypothetical protein